MGVTEAAEVPLLLLCWSIKPSMSYRTSIITENYKEQEAQWPRTLLTRVVTVNKLKQPLIIPTPWIEKTLKDETLNIRISII